MQKVIWSAGPVFFFLKMAESCSVSVRAAIIQFEVISLFQTGAALNSFDLLLLKFYCDQDHLRRFAAVNVSRQHFKGGQPCPSYELNGRQE